MTINKTSYNPKPFIKKLRTSANKFVGSGNKFFKVLAKYSGMLSSEVTTALGSSRRKDSVRILFKERRKALAKLAMPHMNAFVKAHKDLVKLMVKEAFKNQIPEKVQAYKHNKKVAAELKAEMVKWQEETQISYHGGHPKYSAYKKRMKNVKNFTENALTRLGLLIKASLADALPLDLYKLFKEMKPYAAVMKWIDHEIENESILLPHGGSRKVKAAKAWFNKIADQQKELIKLLASFGVSLKEEFMAKQDFMSFFDHGKDAATKLLDEYEENRTLNLEKKSSAAKDEAVADLDSLTVKNLQDLLNALKRLTKGFNKLISVTDQVEIDGKQVLTLINQIVDESGKIRLALVLPRSYCDFRIRDKKNSEILDMLIGFLFRTEKMVRAQCKKYIPDSTVKTKTLSKGLLKQITSYKKILPGVEAVLRLLQTVVQAGYEVADNSNNQKNTPW